MIFPLSTLVSVYCFKLILFVKKQIVNHRLFIDRFEQQFYLKCAENPENKKTPVSYTKRRKDKISAAVPLLFRIEPALEFCNGNSRRNLLKFSLGASRRVRRNMCCLTPADNSLKRCFTSTASVQRFFLYEITVLSYRVNL